MNVMVFCEFSGIVRDAFREQGHNAWSLDILPCEGDHEHHIQGDMYEYVARYGWKTPNGHDIDLLIAHPPCTYLANSGVRWLYNPDGTKNEERWEKMRAASEDFWWFLNAPVPLIAVENPIQHKHAQIPAPDQYIQPWEFGHPERKTIGWWLKGLPELKRTEDVRIKMEQLTKKEQNRVHFASPGADRWKERSRFFPGIAKAMAQQWGSVDFVVKEDTVITLNEQEDREILAQWQKDAEKMTLERLPEFIRHLREDYRHDYGTVCHAMAAGMYATAKAMQEGEQFGITGFQGGAVFWLFEHMWNPLMAKKGSPKKLLAYENMLYPQYEYIFTAIDADTWSWLQQEARDRLEKDTGALADRVREHMRSIVNGIIPFGYRLEGEK